MDNRTTYQPLTSDLTQLFTAQSAYKIAAPATPELGKKSPQAWHSNFDKPTARPVSFADYQAKDKDVSTAKNIIRGLATSATPDKDIREGGQYIPVPLRNGEELHLYLNKQAPKYLCRRWKDAQGVWQRATTGKANFDAARTEAIEAYWQTKNGTLDRREPNFSTMAASFMAEWEPKWLRKQADRGIPNPKKSRYWRLLNGTGMLLAAFCSHPSSALQGKEGRKAIDAWAAARRQRGAGAETLHQAVQLIRAILTHAGVCIGDMPPLPPRSKNRRALMSREDEFRIIRAHLRARCGEYRRGSKHWHGRMMLRLYFDVLTQFSGRTGTELMSATFGGNKLVKDGNWLAIDVNGKLGRATRFGRSRIVKLIATIAKLHPNATPDATLWMAKEYHSAFRDAMTALEIKRNEPGRWTSRVVPGQNAKGGFSLYCVRHGLITYNERQGTSRVATAKVFGTSAAQIEAHYGHLTAIDALDLMGG
jgi:hypothetical protein